MISGLDRYVQDLPHPLVRATGAEAARHRSFIVAGLLAGVTALALLPLGLALGGPDGLWNIVLLALIAAQAPIALLLSATGLMTLSLLLHVVVIGAAVVGAVALDGTLVTPMLVWLCVLTAEAVLSGRAFGLVFAFLASTGALVLPVILGPAPGATIASGWQAPSLIVILLTAVGVGQLAGIALRSARFRRHVDSCLSSSDQLFSRLVNNLPDTALLLSADFSVGYVSPSVSRHLGLVTDDLMGRRLFDRIHVADRPNVLKAVACPEGQTGQDVCFRLNTVAADSESSEPDWRWMDMRLETAPRGTAASSMEDIFEVLAVVRDVSDRKSRECELDRACLTAGQTSLSRTRFLANVTHELRTPLNVIIGFSEILKQELNGKPEYDHQREYAVLINESGEHLLQVVNDIPDMSRIETGNFQLSMQTFDLRVLISTCCRMMEPQAADHGVKVALSVAPDLPEMTADQRACRQILLNLIHNAIKFSKRGSQVLITANCTERTVHLVVQDDGIGIADDILPRLGQPFVQARANGQTRDEGAGLGLSVVRGLVELHDGRLQITSAPGQGTSVHVRLPVSVAPVAGADQRIVDLGAHRAAKAAS